MFFSQCMRLCMGLSLVHALAYACRLQIGHVACDSCQMHAMWAVTKSPVCIRASISVGFGHCKPQT